MKINPFKKMCEVVMGVAVHFKSMCEMAITFASLCMVKQIDLNFQSPRNHIWQCVCVFTKLPQNCTQHHVILFNCTRGGDNSTIKKWTWLKIYVCIIIISFHGKKVINWRAFLKNNLYMKSHAEILVAT